MLMILVKTPITRTNVRSFGYNLTIDLAAVHTTIDEVGAFDPRCATLAETKAGLSAVHAARGWWLQARELEMTQRLKDVSSFPENDSATASRTKQKSATTVMKRAETVARMPEFGNSLSNGNISTKHLDAVTRAMRALKSEDRKSPVRRSSNDLGDSRSSPGKVRQKNLKRRPCFRWRCPGLVRCRTRSSRSIASVRSARCCVFPRLVGSRHQAFGGGSTTPLWANNSRLVSTIGVTCWTVPGYCPRVTLRCCRPRRPTGMWSAGCTVRQYLFSAKK